MAEQLVSIGSLSQRVQQTSNGVGGIVVEFQQVPIDPLTGNAISELPLGAMPALAATMDFPMVNCGYLRTKTLYLVVTTQFTWVTSGTATAQLYIGRTTANSVDSNHPLAGAAVTLASAATTLAVGTYIITPNGFYTPSNATGATGFPELGNFHPFVGLRLVFASAATAGAASAYIEASVA